MMSFRKNYFRFWKAIGRVGLVTVEWFGHNWTIQNAQVTPVQGTIPTIHEQFSLSAGCKFLHLLGGSYKDARTFKRAKRFSNSLTNFTKWLRLSRNFLFFILFFSLAVLDSRWGAFSETCTFVVCNLWPVPCSTLHSKEKQCSQIFLAGSSDGLPSHIEALWRC